MRINRRTKKDTGAVKSHSTKKILSNILNKTDAYWSREQKKRTLQLFHEIATRVPAYKKFLKRHKISPKNIRSFKDLQKVPATTKDNYLQKYTLEQLSWDGALNSRSKNSLVFTSTSGSTGEPIYFSRNSVVDQQAAVIHELFFKNSKFSSKSPTLIIVCFGMGVWVGGIITYQAFEITGRGDYPISIITPGINKEEIFKILKKLSPHFKQTILAGYPPFLKDIVDEAEDRKINLKKLNVRLLFAAEAFTENFRDYLAKKTKVNNVLIDTMNIYGSADIGAMAFETPLSILIRKIAVKNPKIFKSIFSDISKMPTLTQYIPSFISFEERDNKLFLTGNSSIPLVNYSIGDHGGIFTFSQIKEKLFPYGINLHKEAKMAGIKDHMYQLPFVYVYERIDMSTTLYGLQIYPETIKEVLLKKPFFEFLTGKLTLISKFDVNHNQYLEINLELRKKRKMSNMLKTQLLNEIVNNLRSKNSEFRELSDFLENRASPTLIFWPQEDPLYFKPGIKQKWVDK
jgi:phenylacetate-CoA ligase